MRLISGLLGSVALLCIAMFNVWDPVVTRISLSLWPLER